MHIHRPAGAVKLIAPDGVEQLVPGKYGTRPLHQQAQDLELLQSQGNIPVPVPDNVPLRVHKEAAQGVGLLLRLVLPRVAQGGAHPGHQLHHAEGLGYIVVRPLIQSQHLVVLGALGGEHDDRQGLGGGHGAQALEYLQTVLLGQHDIQQHQLRAALLHGLPKLGGTVKPLGLHALAL